MKILNNKQCKQFIDLAVSRLNKYIKENNLKGITTGISGGIDSAVTAVIGVQSINRLNNQGYRKSFKYCFIDCESNEKDFQKAKNLADKFKFKIDFIDLNQWYKNSPLLEFISHNHPKAKIAQGNIKARLRMISLYQIALLNNYVYLDSDDLSEHWMGFWTRHGDEGDVKIIQQVTKTEMYDLGEYLEIPEIILRSAPGDGLGVTKRNLAVEQLGLDYIYIDFMISRFIENGFDFNGSFNQLKTIRFIELAAKVAQEINKPIKSINKVLEQSLKTAYKRKYGDYAANLMPERKEFGFLKIGSKAHNEKYLTAIINEYGKFYADER